jgi:hypothetical protein
VTRFPIGRLSRGHDTKSFDCGDEELNSYLRRYALQNQERHSAAVTYVASTEGTAAIAAYYTLSNAREERHNDMPGRQMQSQTGHNRSDQIRRKPPRSVNERQDHDSAFADFIDKAIILNEDLSNQVVGPGAGARPVLRRCFWPLHPP